MTSLSLTTNDKKFLLNLARQVLQARINHQEISINKPDSMVLDICCGVFVSLHKNQELRGCIGYVRGIKPLKEAVQEMAVSAAFEDPRFPPVEQQELEDLEIEISVLSPLKSVTDMKVIEIGRHGLIVEKGIHRGLLLPQVATQYNWDAKTFIEQTCIKAGLPADAWKEKDTRIQIFSAEVFSEADY